MTLTVTRQFGAARQGGAGEARVTPRHPAAPVGRGPRITRLMALAIKFDQYVQDGVVSDYAELARLGQVTRARISQVMDLNLLAPDIQEAILSLPRTVKGRDPIRERHVRKVVAAKDWEEQRRAWRRIAPVSEAA